MLSQLSYSPKRCQSLLAVTVIMLRSFLLTSLTHSRRYLELSELHGHLLVVTRSSPLCCGPGRVLSCDTAGSTPAAYRRLKVAVRFIFRHMPSGRGQDSNLPSLLRPLVYSQVEPSSIPPKLASRVFAFFSPLVDAQVATLCARTSPEACSESPHQLLLFIGVPGSTPNFAGAAV